MKAVPHRHVVFSIPKILRRYFLYDRKLLSDLSRCGWEALKAFYTTGVRDTEAVPGAVIAIQTFGDLLGFHPHLHILVSDGCFHENGMFTVCPAGDAKTLEQVFRHKVLRMLRMTYHRETGQVQYRSKDKKKIHPELTNKDFQSITPFDTRSKMLPAFVSQKGILSIQFNYSTSRNSLSRSSRLTTSVKISWRTTSACSFPTSSKRSASPLMISLASSFPSLINRASYATITRHL